MIDCLSSRARRGMRPRVGSGISKEPGMVCGVYLPILVCLYTLEELCLRPFASRSRGLECHTFPEAGVLE